MTDSKLYVARDVVRIDYSDLETNVLNIDQVVFKDKYGANFDFGKFAYRERAFGLGRRKGGVVPVFLPSIDCKRLPFLYRIFEMIRMTSTGNQMVSLSYLSLFFSYIDEGKLSVDFESFDSVIKVYIRFVETLKYRTQINTNVALKRNKKTLTTSYARNVKKLIEDAIAIGFDVAVNIVSSKTPITIKSSFASEAGRRRARAITKESLKRHVRSCENFILVVHGFLEGELTLPLEFGVDDSKSYLHGVENNTLYSRDFKDFLVGKSYILNRDDFHECRSIFVKSQLRPTPLLHRAYEQYRNDVDKSINENAYKVLLANYAITIAAHLFGIITRSNQSVVLDCKIHTMKFDPTTKGYRTSGLKSRARNRQVFPEFGARFVPTMKKILDIREWILEGGESEWMWCLRATRKNQKKPYIVKRSLYLKKRQKDKKITGSRPQYHSESGVKGIISRLYPEIAWVNSRNARNTSSVIINDLAKGDIEKSSTMMSNTQAVFTKHYIDKALDDVAGEVGEFLTLLRNSAISSTRKVDSIPVPIIEKQDSESIPSGSCTESFNPERIDTFTDDAPVPDCQRFENCLFCKHFAMHTDEVDIRKLISLQFLMTSIRGVGGDIESYNSSWGVINHRIEEILFVICEQGNGANELVKKIRIEVEENELLDDFWSVHLNSLLDAGIVL